jgi:hypothetical protein
MYADEGDPLSRENVTGLELDPCSRTVADDEGGSRIDNYWWYACPGLERKYLPR